MNKTETLVIGALPAASDDEDPIAYSLVTALLFALIGTGLAVAGIFMLFGAGWAMLAAALPLIVLSGVLLRGLKHA